MAEPWQSRDSTGISFQFRVHPGFVELECAAREDRGAVLVDARKVTVGHEPIIHPERFGEIVATNRGALARVFTDMDVALAWLQG